MGRTDLRPDITKEVLEEYIRKGYSQNRMSRKEYQGMLQIAKEQVPMGIYAVEKADYAEFRRDKCESITKLKELTRQFKSQGFKVWSNGKDK